MKPLKRWLDSVTDSNATLPLVLLFFRNLVDEFDQVLYGVVAPEIRTTFGISEQAVITIATVSGAVVIMTSVYMGVLADRHNRIMLTRGAAVLWMVMSMLTGVAGFLVVLPLLIAARVGSGLGRVMNEPVHASLLADYYPTHTHTHGRVFSVHRQGNPIGLILALGGGLLADVIGWRETFIVLAIPTLIVIAVISKLPNPPRGAQVDLDLAIAAEAKGHKIPLGEGWRRLKAIPTLKRTWVAAFFLGAAVVPITSFISFFFENVYGIETNFGRSAILTFFGFGSIIGINLGARYATRALAGFDLPKLSVYGGRSLIAGAACLVGMALAPWIGLSLAFLFLAGVVSVGFTSYNLPLVAAIAPPRLRSQAFAYFVFFFGLGAIVIAGFASGIAEDHGYRQGLAILAFFEALAGLIYISSKRFSMRDAEIALTTLTAEVELNAEAMGGDTDAILTCRKVEVAYDRVQVLFGVDMDVRRGECVALLGTNGAGESTVLNAISGIVEPIGGAIFFEGRDITHLSTADTAELGIVVVPGGKAVFPTLTVAEHLRAASWLFRGPGGGLRGGRRARPGGRRRHGRHLRPHPAGPVGHRRHRDQTGTHRREPDHRHVRRRLRGAGCHRHHRQGAGPRGSDRSRRIVLGRRCCAGRRRRLWCRRRRVAVVLPVVALRRVHGAGGPVGHGPGRRDAVGDPAGCELAGDERHRHRAGGHSPARRRDVVEQAMDRPRDRGGDHRPRRPTSGGPTGPGPS